MMLPIPTPGVSPGAAAFGASTMPALSSTTAPGKAFASRSELQQHYQSDWHRYNLKRREAGLPMLNESDFNSRLEAAMALRKEREGRDERTGMDHRKDKSGTKKKKDNKNKQQGKSHRRKPAFAKREEVEKESGNPEESEEIDQREGEPMPEADHEDDASMEEEPPEINPSQSLFDNHISATPSLNLEYMQTTYSFYLPDSEYCTDVEGFLGYCNEKVRLGNICLSCQKSFKSTEAVLKHMKDKRHCTILYESGVDQEELDVFYDFSAANREFLGENTNGERGGDEVMEEADDGDGMEEDLADVEGDDDDLYAAYEKEIATHGFDITPLGELIFPDGRIIGHRGLARYYKQRFAPDRMERAAVRHAREAAGERLYRGRVVNLHRLTEGGEEISTENGPSSTALAPLGGMSGSNPTGRIGAGILLAGKGGKSGFTALSLYRYRAVVKKARRETAQGQRLAYRTAMNTNKMDKKHNNLMTGVCTAMMPR